MEHWQWDSRSENRSKIAKNVLKKIVSKTRHIDIIKLHTNILCYAIKFHLLAMGFMWCKPNPPTLVKNIIKSILVVDLP